MIVGGLDEAGRGAIAGDLVVAGYAANENLIESFKRVGIKDSKKVSAKKRKGFYPFLERRGKIVVESIHPEEIDKYVSKQVPGRSLNYLEAIYMAQIIDELGADVVYVDSPYINLNRLWTDLRGLIKNQSVRIIPEHHADVTHVIVGAASICAKVKRDEAMEELKKKFGPMGSGYPGDRKTRDFLTGLVKKTGVKPEWTRHSWSSWDGWLTRPQSSEVCITNTQDKVQKPYKTPQEVPQPQ